MSLQQEAAGVADLRKTLGIEPCTWVGGKWHSGAEQRSVSLDPAVGEPIAEVLDSRSHFASELQVLWTCRLCLRSRHRQKLELLTSMICDLGKWKYRSVESE